MLLKPYYQYQIQIDGDEVVLRLKRFNVSDAQAFAPMWRNIIESVKLRYAVRRPDEMARDEKGEYVVSQDQIADRRIQEMTADEQAAYRREEDAAEAEARTHIVTAITEFVTIERGLVEELPDGRQQSLTTGEEFLRYHGGRWELLGTITGMLALVNLYGADQKKVSSSPAASPPSSAGRKDRGRKPKTTVARAGTKDSAASGAATATSDGLSGSTATSSRPNVRSVN